MNSEPLAPFYTYEELGAPILKTREPTFNDFDELKAYAANEDNWVTDDSGLEEGMEVYVPSLHGWVHGVIRIGEHGKCYAESKNGRTVFVLSWDKSGRNETMCWKSIGAANTAAIKKLQLSP